MNSPKNVSVCFICKTIPLFGKSAGIYIKNKFLCSECEKKILHMKSHDPIYDGIKEKLKYISIDGY